MIVGVIAMGVMQSPIMHAIEVRAVLKHLVIIARAVGDMPGDRLLAHRVGGADLEDMLIHVVGVHHVEMPVVEIIHVTCMLDCLVPAAAAMLMVMLGVQNLMRQGRRPRDGDRQNEYCD